MTEPLIGQCARCGGSLSQCLHRGCQAETMTPTVKLPPRQSRTQEPSESEIQSAIRLALGRLPDVLLFRNNTGALPDRKGRLVRYGLAVGSSDLVGIVTRADGTGVFIAIEVKDARGKVTDEQEQWLALVRRYGGAAGVARSVKDALGIYREAKGIPETEVRDSSGNVIGYTVPR